MEEQRLLKKKSKAANNSAALVSACTDLAAYYSSVGQFTKAINEYEVLLKIYKQEKQMLLFAQVHRGLGEAYMGLHEFKKTLQCFKTYHKQEGNLLEQQRALAQLGHLYLTWYLETISESNRELLDQAFGYLMRSMKKCENLSDSMEKQDIIARLFSNLGLVKENLGELETAYHLYEKSIKICVAHDLYEQLYRGYLSKASLLEKQKKYQETIKNYNLAIEAATSNCRKFLAEKLSTDRVELICAALLSKSETLIKIADFQGAKQVLRKAYKFKSPNKQERKIIERNLRVGIKTWLAAVAGMCKVEDSIITCSEQPQLKGLYEKMGDGACDLKIFSKAIEYYKKMLEAAEKSGASDKELGECYFSLAKTYKDNGNYEEAECYFEKEYNICKTSLKDSLNTLCELADLKELANQSADCVKRVYERALLSCRKKHSLLEERRILIRYRGFLERSRCSFEASKVTMQLEALQSKLGDLEEESSSSECESDDSAKVHIGDDIVLSEITDVSEESDNEVPETNATQSSKRRRPNTVQYWLDVDHPVNVRDNAGWLPLHEAAVHGHIEIVRLLLDHKASINDRGASECNGITPLHDAASNGHLEIIELLLNKGASALAKTDDGNTPLFELRKWFQRNGEDLSSERLSFYHSVAGRLEAALEKSGQKDTGILSPNHSKEIHQSASKVGRLRRAMPMGDCLEDEEEDDFPASNEYQEVMQTMRRKTFSPQISPVASKRSALVNEEDFVEPENWLEEDVRRAKPKRRRTSEFGVRSRSFGEANKSPIEADFLAAGNDDSLDAISIGSADSRSSSRRRQATLLEAGFSKERPSPNHPQQNQLEAERPSTPFQHQECSQPAGDPMLFADVDIEGKVFRVPVRMSQLQSKTIKWLAAEAALRYESKEFMKPVLELETVDGVILVENDLLSLLFPMGRVQAERVVGKVTEWSLASVLERYKETCANMGVDANAELCDLVATLSVSLDISSRGLLGDALGPLLKSLNNQKALTQINLSGNFLNGHAVALLCSSLGTLSNLEVLNLSACSLQKGHLSQLAGAISCNAPLLSKLSSLDLSDNNALQNACLKDLSVISNSLNLKRLNVSNTDLRGEPQVQQVLCLTFLEELNVSYNQLSDSALREMLGWLDPLVLRALNASRNSLQRGLMQVLEVHQSLAALQQIDFECCGVDDSDVFALLRSAPNITHVNLSNNPDLTSISLRRLLEHATLNYVNVQYCDSIWAYFDTNAAGWGIALGRKSLCKIAKGPQTYQNCLIQVFEEKHKDHLKVDVSYYALTVAIN
ncbi:hypothetical protein YQE_06424, partial [Dendroctonus ponderosae]